MLLGDGYSQTALNITTAKKPQLAINLQKALMATRTHTVHHAIAYVASVSDGNSIALSITARDPIDTADKPLSELKKIFEIDALNLADAMFASLPGGTIDALISEFLRRRASLFVVPFNSPAKS